MKAFVIKIPAKKLISFAGATLIFLLVTITVCNKTIAQTNKLLPIYAVNTEEPFISLTFDCAWEDTDLDEISGILDENNVRATFFVTGEFANHYSEKLKVLAQKGHEVGNHSNHHPHVASISTEKLKQDTIDCNEAIKKAIGGYPKLYRAPYGEFDNEVVLTINELNMPFIQWDCDSRDWQEGATVASINNYININIQNGSILLFHVDAKPKMTAKALKAIIPELKSKGYEFKLVSDMIYNPPYKLDAKGRMSKCD